MRECKKRKRKEIRKVKRILEKKRIRKRIPQAKCAAHLKQRLNDLRGETREKVEERNERIEKRMIDNSRKFIYLLSKVYNQLSIVCIRFIILKNFEY